MIDLTNNGFTDFLPATIVELGEDVLTVSENNVMLPANDDGAEMCEVIDGCENTWISHSICAKCGGSDTPTQTPTRTPTISITASETIAPSSSVAPSPSASYQLLVVLSLSGITIDEITQEFLDSLIQTIATRANVPTSSVTILAINAVLKAGVAIEFVVVGESEDALEVFDAALSNTTAFQAALDAQLLADGVDVHPTVESIVGEVDVTPTPSPSMAPSASVAASATRSASVAASHSRASHDDDDESTSASSSQFMWTSLLVVLGAIVCNVRM